MKGSVLGRRYAGALLDIGIGDGQADAFGRQLHAAVESLGSVEARKALTSPLYELAFKKTLLETVAKEADLAAPVKNFLLLLLDKGRINILAEIDEAYREMLDEHVGLARASVVSAVPLDGAALARLRVLLQKKIGRKVELTATTDTKVIGGLRVQIGSKVYDATIANHLTRLRETLKTV